MNNADFWASVRAIIAEGFTPEGLHKLDSYAEQFISGRLVYQRFSPREQHGCTAGGEANQACRRFVKDDNRRILDEHTGNGHTLLLAAAQSQGTALEPFRQLHHQSHVVAQPAGIPLVEWGAAGGWAR